LIRRYVAGEEAKNIMFHCHSSSYGGHHSGERKAAKVLQSGLWRPTVFKNCQRTCNVSQRNEKPQNGILEIEPFDCWGIKFMGPFSSSYSHLHILLCVDYITKLVEAISCIANDAPVVVISFIETHIH